MPPCSHLSAAQRTQLKLQAGCESPILRTFSRTTPLLQAGLYHTFFFFKAGKLSTTNLDSIWLINGPSYSDSLRRCHITTGKNTQNS